LARRKRLGEEVAATAKRHPDSTIDIRLVESGITAHGVFVVITVSSFATIVLS